MSKLQAENLSKHYRNFVAVDDVSFHIESGDVVGLLGPNGAGKTTSFYMVVGLVRANTGTITLDGEDLSHLPMHARARKGIGYLPQEASVFRRLTVRQNIIAILETRKDLDKQQRNQACDSLMQELHISHLHDKRGNTLSGGERRRVEIARTLATEPKFILLDEPFAGVDPISVIDIQRLVRHLVERNIGVLITDHNVRETLGICDRAYILSGGKIIAHGDAETVTNNEEVRRVYLGDQFQY